MGLEFVLHGGALPWTDLIIYKLMESIKTKMFSFMDSHTINDMSIIMHLRERVLLRGELLLVDWASCAGELSIRPFLIDSDSLIPQ